MEHVVVTVLGLAGLLALTSLLLPAAKWLNFPYTVLLAAVGCLLGVVVVAVGEVGELGLVGDFLSALKGFSITSEMVLFIFLPTLVFESALAIDVRRLLDDISPILLLAVIGLLISTFLVAGALYAFAGVTFVVCLLLGAIVSATDPVAVVAIFKDLGAPKRLTILVEGESLFNDATAIVLYTILLKMLIGGREADLLAGAADFVTVFLGGIVVGFVFARAVCWLIGRLRGVPLVEITLTVCLAYLVFILAEHYLHVSGVMAVVTAALVVGSFGRTTISPGTWHPLIETWEQLSFWANSLIFVLVGLAVPEILALGMAELGPPAVVGLLVVLLVAAFAARALILYGLLPVLSRSGLAERVSGAYKTVMLWGGLRGAVSLALALAVLENPELGSDVKSFVVVLITGFVLFTLFVNAPTMRPLLRVVGLDKLSPADLAIRNKVLALSLAHIGASMQRVARDCRVAAELAGRVGREYEDRFAEAQANLARVEGLKDEDRVRIGLTILSNRERRLYLKHFEDRLISPHIARVLLAQADKIADGVKTGGVAGYEVAVKATLGFPLGFRAALYGHRLVGLTRPLAGRLADRFEVLLATQTVLRALMVHDREKIAPLLGAEAGAALGGLLRRRLEATEQALDALKLQYPDYANAVEARLLGRVAVRLEDAEFRQMLEEQVISQEVFKDLQGDVAERAAALERRPRLDLGLEPAKLVARVPYFAEIEAGRVRDIAALLKPRLVVPGERVVRKGEAGDAMYFISTGAVEVALDPGPVRLGSGEFFGELALLTEQPRVADVTALGYCQLLVLYVRDFRRLLAADPDLRQAITRVAEARLGSGAPAQAPTSER